MSNGTGTMGAADVASVSIACVSNFGLLYSFTGGSGDAADPYHTLIQGSDGDFYGTTLAGGTSNAGTIFKVTQSGSESVFYSFASIPYSGLAQSSDGNIYGTTASGGTSGRGTVLVLYSFPAGSSDPYTGLIQGSDGTLYGSTTQAAPRASARSSKSRCNDCGAVDKPRLSRYVGQPHHIPVNSFAAHKAQRRPRTGEEWLPVSNHDRVQVESILIDQTEIGEALRQLWPANFNLPGKLTLQPTYRRLKVIPDKRGAVADRL